MPQDDARGGRIARLQPAAGLSCYIVLPLAFRISLPALNNNLVNLVKTTTLAYAIAVPEMLYVSSQIWSDELNVPEMMNVLLVCYFGAGRRARLRDAPLGARDARAGVRRMTRAAAGPSAAARHRPAGAAAGAPIACAARRSRRARCRRPARALRAAHGVALLALLVRRLRRSAQAQAGAGAARRSSTTIWKWTPLLLRRASCSTSRSASLAMAIGTVARRAARPRADLAAAARCASGAWFVTHFFRNAPWLVLLFYCMFLLPFQVTLFGVTIPLPDWVKATFGLRCR